ncbi:uncharacterized protein LOC111366065 isoform X2 [Olea europaea subsp. europaea]|uniref:Uncharacterized protein LOC111366065 isoform X2 n=1 Tax=Olea europaea subsp. europaea TaxID=158383 RepID=A0A8S0SKD6_OLEEU|nr:uncharacterized protein LOC111366065 isoform X2 [Olea europaea subsp. europaea]
MAELPETQASSSTSDHNKSSEEVESQNNQTQVPAFHGLQSPNGDVQMFPFMYPALVPQLYSQQNEEQMNRGPGLYAVPVLRFAQPIAGFPPNTLIPFTYNVPVSPETGAAGDVQGQVGEQPQNQPQQQPGPQRQVIVRRFQIVFHLDIPLILKLAAVIFLFSQDGSRQRLTLLVFFASLVYFYQTGVLAPFVRWLSQGMQRAAAPPEPRRRAVRAENVPAAEREANENAAAAGGQPEGQNENPQANDGNRAFENEHEVEPAEGNVGNRRWWGIVKEIQMIVFGFITSLLPGFHNID